MRIAWGGAGGEALATRLPTPTADNNNNDGHIGDVRADGVVEDDGDDDDLDDNNDDEGKDKKGDDDVNNVVILGKAAAAAAPTTRMVATMATMTKVTWMGMVEATTTTASMTSTMTTTTMGQPQCDGGKDNGTTMI